MRPRKLNGAALRGPPREDIMDVFPADDVPMNEVSPPPDEPPELPGSGRVCIACGGEGGGREGCEHAEVARLEAPSRAVMEAVARLQQAAAEHRAAVRAVRSLVMSEVARGRAELEVKPPPPRAEATTAVVCPRCAEQEAESSGTGHRASGARRRHRAAIAQETFVFAREPEPPTP